MIYLFPRFINMLVPWRLLFVIMKLPMTLNRPGLHGGGWDYSLFFFAFFQFVIVPLNLCASSPLRWDGTPSLTRHIHLLVCNGFDGAWPNCSKWVLTGGHTSSNQRLTWNTRKSLGGICAHLFFFSTKKQSETSIDGRPEFPNLFHQFFFPPSDFVEGKPEAKNRRMIFIRRAVLFCVKFSWEAQLPQSPWGLLWIPIGLWCVTWHPLGWVGVKNKRFRLDRKIAGCSHPPVGSRMNTEMMGSLQPAHVYFPVPIFFGAVPEGGSYVTTFTVASWLVTFFFLDFFVVQNFWDSLTMTTMTWFDPAC